MPKGLEFRRVLFRSVLEQMLFIDDRQIFERDSARQRTAAKGGRSEERRVGEEGRSRWSPAPYNSRRHTRCLRDWSSDVFSSDLFSSRCSSSTIARYSSATRHASGPPPKVVPCCPGEIAEAKCYLDRNAPSGTPAAI